MNNQLIIENMKQLGMTEYEIKVYLTLLSHHPSTGYNISKLSGVPRSRVYEVLDGLSKKQLVFETTANDKTTYVPLEPSLLMKMLKNNFNNIIDQVDVYTQRLYHSGDQTFDAKILKGRDEVIAILIMLIQEAQTRIALSIWEEELLELKEVIERARERGVAIRGIYFGREKIVDDLVTHRRVDRYLAEKDERYLIAIVDDSEMISGVISRGNETRATWTKDRDDIDISDDYIAHDVMVNVYASQLEGKVLETYEASLDAIRKDYFNYSDEVFKQFKDF